MVLWREHLFVANVLDPDQRSLAGGRPEVHGGRRVRRKAEPVGIARLPPVRRGDRPRWSALRVQPPEPVLERRWRAGAAVRSDNRQLHRHVHQQRRRPDGGCTDQLNSPEGIVFGPDGRLYVTSLRAKRRTRHRQDPDLRGARQRASRHLRRQVRPRRSGPSESTAAALLFGPGGDLFVPITNAFSRRRLRQRPRCRPPLPGRLHADDDAQMLHQLRRIPAASSARAGT